MASTQQLKNRIRSVGNTRQITRAMQLVAASKMRRTQEATKASAPYTDAANSLLTKLALQVATDKHPLFARRKIKKRLIIFIASDKGLAGAYNSNVFKRYLEVLRHDDDRGIENTTITVGRKASQLVARLKNTKVTGSFDDLPDRPSVVAFYTIRSTAINMYANKEVDAVTMVYTNFVNSIKQEAETIRLLPAGTSAKSDPEDIEDSPLEVKYEPSAEELLDGITYRLIGARIFQALLDSRASEYSMRMLAMKNATDNANDLIDDLTLAMNKARQAAITQELSEISGGVEAIS